MTPENMRAVAGFAKGLKKMADAARKNEPVTLYADENKAMVTMLQILAKKPEPPRPIINTEDL